MGVPSSRRPTWDTPITSSPVNSGLATTENLRIEGGGRYHDKSGPHASTRPTVWVEGGGVGWAPRASPS